MKLMHLMSENAAVGSLLSGSNAAWQAEELRTEVTAAVKTLCRHTLSL
jgi:hypothetical protein